MSVGWTDYLLLVDESAIALMPWWGWAVVVGVIIAWFSARPARHAWRIRAAGQAIRTLKKIGRNSGPRAQFGFLRYRIDPFVFEEAILTALARRGIRIVRNRRYTGDGGIDGRCYFGGRLVLIQAKKYTEHIKPQDVRQHLNLCRRHLALGLFVHTGKTGPASRQLKCSELDIVSGDRLLALLCGEEVRFFLGCQKYR